LTLDHSFFSFNDTATTEFYTLSLHDALPILLLGVTHADTEAAADYLAEKVAGLRIFEDDAGKMNLSLADVGGAILVVSQFTLYGDRKSTRLNSSHVKISYAVFCWQKKNQIIP